jgi:uncharacterized membrane protein YbhN (UPF0104 family)
MTGSQPTNRWRWLGPVASAAIFLASVGVLWIFLRETDTGEVLAALGRTARDNLWMAVGFTALSYALLTFYDALALKRLGLSIPWRTTALGSYTSFSVSFTLGFPLVTAGAVRHWIYAPRGVRTSEVAKITVLVGLTFWLGMGLVLGAMLIAAAAPLSAVARASPMMLQAAGAAILVIGLAYLVWVRGGERSIAVRGWKLELPGTGMSLLQILIGAADVCAAGAVLYVLLPAGHGVPFEAFLAVYVFAAVVGTASHLPGGVGAFEATMLLGLPQVAAEPMLGALLLFRVIYYIGPFVLALMLLGLYEIGRRLTSRPGGV